MSLEGYLTLLFSFGVNAVALWGVFRKKRTEVKADEAKVDGVIEDGAIGRWQAFAARLEGKIDKQERDLAEMRSRELQCIEKTARQDEQIKGLMHALKTLRADLKRAGINHGSGLHEPLNPEEPAPPDPHPGQEK